MSDPTYREIHLSGKQLVFLFMASVVLAVSVFLLGVSVGRGVRGATSPASATTSEATSPGDTEAPVVMPPPTETSAADSGYHDQLQGQTPAQPIAERPAEPPPPVVKPATPAVPPSPATTTAAKGLPTPPVAAAAPPAKPGASGTAKASTSPAAPAAKPGWFVQVGVFSSRENATRLVGQLKAKGYTAFSEPSGTRGSMLRVRVGPFADSAEAQRSAVRLRQEEGFKPSVTR